MKGRAGKHLGALLTWVSHQEEEGPHSPQPSFTVPISALPGTSQA